MQQPPPPPDPGPAPARTPARGVLPPRSAPAGPGRSRLRSLATSIPAIVILLAMVGSTIFIGYVVASVDDNQIPLLAAGFVVLGASLGAIALWSLFGMWKAASRARGGRALGLAILGGLAGIGAIGCFAIAVVASLVSSQ